MDPRLEVSVEEDWLLGGYLPFAALLPLLELLPSVEPLVLGFSALKLDLLFRRNSLRKLGILAIYQVCGMG